MDRFLGLWKLLICIIEFYHAEECLDTCLEQ